jgi:hypothetical protein
MEYPNLLNELWWPLPKAVRLILGKDPEQHFVSDADRDIVGSITRNAHYAIKTGSFKTRRDAGLPVVERQGFLDWAVRVQKIELPPSVLLVYVNEGRPDMDPGGIELSICFAPNENGSDEARRLLEQATIAEQQRRTKNQERRA